ncbi:ribosome recycling factor [Gynuella sp.]|uniref:ribosome recycling factor n=1 Tax=Gynuella sp. TaxID=2969146 RepID=UPI003D14D4AD
MIEELKVETEDQMKKALEALEYAFNKIRTGRANPSLLDTLHVSYYGSDTPLNQVANVSVEDGRTLAINPWEKQLVPEIEKAILKSDLGLNPATSGSTIRIVIPALTEETRKDMVKLARSEAEKAKVSVRNQRRDANSVIKDLLKEKEISEDDSRHEEDIIQKLTDDYIAKIDSKLLEKEADLMKV